MTGSRSFRSFLQTLPDRIAEAEAEGRPIVVELPPTLDPANQRLLATLGCQIKFKEAA